MARLVAMVMSRTLLHRRTEIAGEKEQCLPAIAPSVVRIIFISLILTVSSASVFASEEVYKAKCAICHGADGTGNTVAGRKAKAKDLGSEEVQKQPDDDLIAVVTSGKEKMPAFREK